jgi:hypothetical protein
MSIIRIGLAETKNFSEGYDLIFGKKDAEQPEAKKDEAKNEESKEKSSKKKK